MKPSVFILGVLIATGGTASAQTAACVPNDNQVAVYEHGGGDKRGLGRCEVLDMQVYPDLSKTKLGKGAMSSIKVGKNVYAIVCNQVDFKGACEVHDSDDGDLRDNPTVKNDSAASIKVLQGKVCSPQGDQKVAIKWVNKTKKPIRVNWIRFDCTEESNNRLIAPDAIYDGDTFVGHVFRVREEGTKKNLGLIYVTTNNAGLDIK